MKSTLNDTPEMRRKRLRAYRAGQYTMQPPPVYSGNWDEEAWMNHVLFKDRNLNGFMPYNAPNHRAACATL